MSARVAALSARRSDLRSLSRRQRAALVLDAHDITHSLERGLAAITVGRALMLLVVGALGARTGRARLVRALRYTLPFILRLIRSRRKGGP